jgi:hypothetical protein
MLTETSKQERLRLAAVAAVEAAEQVHERDEEGSDALVAVRVPVDVWMPLMKATLAAGEEER